MKLNLSLIVIFTALFGFAYSEKAIADDAKDGLVEVHNYEDTLALYKDRRTTHGMYVGITYESIEFINYISTLDGQKYGALFGSDGVPLIRLDLSYKYNFSLGSLAAGVDFGTGEISSSASGSDRSLSVSKYGISLKYTVDNIMSEPYVAPYVGFNIWQMGISEKGSVGSYSKDTDIGYSYTLGLLLQLDWIDWESAKLTTFNWGLQNTFVDLYTTQYAKTSSTQDPNTETDFLFGAGLRLEF